MVGKILRRCAPQNDRERGRDAPQNDRRGGEPRLRMTERGESAPQNDSSLVILSEAKNLSSWLRGMVQKILRSEAPQNDRERGRDAPQNDRGG